MKIKQTYAQGEHSYTDFKTEAEAMTFFNNEKIRLTGYVSEPWQLECTEDTLTVWDGDEMSYQVTLIR